MASGTQNGVGVALKTLYNLFTLQVPNIDHVVFTTGNDPLKDKNSSLNLFAIEDKIHSHLSTSNGEVGENAVTLILMASVRLQALSFRVVPQL